MIEERRRDCTIALRRWLNEGEVEHAYALTTQRADLFGSTVMQERMATAARYLAQYVEIVNDHSDGWPYWTAASRPAEPLCHFVSHVLSPLAHFDEGYECACLDAKTLERAIRRIETFCSRRKLPMRARPKVQRQRPHAPPRDAPKPRNKRCSLTWPVNVLFDPVLRAKAHAARPRSCAPRKPPALRAGRRRACPRNALQRVRDPKHRVRDGRQ